MSKTNGWTKVGTLMKNKDASKDNYIKIEDGITLEKGSFIQVQCPRKKIDKLVANGTLSEEEGAERKKRIPDFVLRELVIAPARK